MGLRGLKYYGFGKAGPGTRSGQNQCYGMCLKSFNLTFETDSEDLTCWTGDGNCTQQVQETIINTETFGVEVSTNRLDWLTMQLLLGREAVITTALDMSIPKPGVVGAGGVLSDPSLTGTDITEVAVSTGQCSAGTGEERHFVVSLTAPTTTDEVQLAPGSLIFDPSLEGLSVRYCQNMNFTDIETIGYESGNLLTELSFHGVACPPGCDDLTDGFVICVPRMQLSPNFTLEIGETISETAITYTPLANGVTDLPVFMAKLPNNVY